jgi:glycosyltransferase involved in cell wall biosynthesis
VISVLILTKNEEQDLPACLQSVGWCDDIHVFDSYSTDRTVPIAMQAGAHVTQRHFDDWSTHQNFALQKIPFKHPWVFYLDADERVSPELRSSLMEAVGNPGQNVAFRVQRRDFFLKTWLKHVQVTDVYIRLFRAQKMRYERLVNPISTPDGPVGEAVGYLDHFPFSKGMRHWLDRHNSYSTFESEQITHDQHLRKASGLKAIFAEDFNERRRHQKEIFFQLPGRPLIKFFLLYFLKGGFLDGKAGFTYAVLQSFYEYMIVLKTRELASGTQRREEERGSLKELKNASPL